MKQKKQAMKQEQKHNKEPKFNGFFWLAIIIFIVLAVIKINFVQSLWFDPGFSLEFVAQTDVVDMFINPVDVHPPVYYVILKGWTAVVGESVYLARTLSAIFGIFFFNVLFQIIAKLFKDERFAGKAILVIVLSSSFLSIFTEIRMYALALLITAFGFLSLLRSKKMDLWKDKHIAIWFACVILSLWTYYYTVFFHLMTLVYIYLFRKKDLWKSIKMFLMYAWPFAIPLAIFFLTQLSKIDGMWVTSTSFMSFFSSLYFIFVLINSNLASDFETVFGLLFVVSLLVWGLIYMFKFAPKTEKRILLFLFIMGTLPQILGLFVDKIYEVYHHRYFVFTMWAWVLFGIRSIVNSNIPEGLWRNVKRIMWLFTISILVLGTINYFDTVSDEIEPVSQHINKQFCNSSYPVLHESPFTSVVSQYYLRTSGCKPYPLLFTTLTERELASAGGVVISKDLTINNTIELEKYNKLLYYRADGNDLLNWTEVKWYKIVVLDLDGLDLVYAEQVQEVQKENVQDISVVVEVN